uniref:Uncharacterized protein n=1 Tax=Rhizophora mucronata TaxID=61149 RepID=A0A2P2IYA3_RHIMU
MEVLNEVEVFVASEWLLFGISLSCKPSWSRDHLSSTHWGY